MLRATRGLLLLIGFTAAISAASCKDQSHKPLGLDPIVLVSNPQSTYSPVVLAFYDQSGQAQVNTFAPFESRCVEFTSASEADSVRFVVVVGDTLGQHGPYSKQWSPWFDPRTGIPGANPDEYPHGLEYWKLTVNDQAGASIEFLADPPCTP